jgi:hypothetical protein
MTLDPNPAKGIFTRGFFVKLDVSGCPDAPAPLSRIEGGLIGTWRMDSEYGADWSVHGAMTLRADRPGQCGYHQSYAYSLTHPACTAPKANGPTTKKRGRSSSGLPPFLDHYSLHSTSGSIQKGT